MRYYTENIYQVMFYQTYALATTLIGANVTQDEVEEQRACVTFYFSIDMLKLQQQNDAVQFYFKTYYMIATTCNQFVDYSISYLL